ncbi:MAG: hypothetical protein LV480_13210 [Methylacidiphilales bacterium]|nr:hypothetical protein [Candidatus Methylacidiphilales bacterium]
MQAIEFSAELNGNTLTIPPNVLSQLPGASIARVILLLDGDTEDKAWKEASYRQFLKDDAPEDAAYDLLG